jgi:hypothetical protein
MSSKKKPRPLFEVPADIETGGESGWVYRSGGDLEHPKSAREEAPATSAFALGFAAIAQTMVLGLTIATLPLTVGLRLLRSFTRPE